MTVEVIFHVMGLCSGFAPPPITPKIQNKKEGLLKSKKKHT